jgi:hypothetical protein
MDMAPHDLAQVSRKPQAATGDPVYNDKAGKGSMAMGKAGKGKKQAMPKKPKPAKGGGMKAK